MQRQGFTVLEVLVGVVIAVVLFLPLSDMLVTGATAVQYTEDYLRALTIAKGQIEMLRHAVQINKYAVDHLLTDYIAKGGFQPFVVDGVYHVTLEVDPQFSSSDLRQDVELPATTSRLVHVRARVDWQIAGPPRKLELAAFIDREYY